MDLNVYAASKIAESRLAELREERARVALVESVRAPRRSVGVRVGAALIRAGQWLASDDRAGGGATRGPHLLAHSWAVDLLDEALGQKHALAHLGGHDQARPATRRVALPSGSS
jgi:hypothetical protein